MSLQLIKSFYVLLFKSKLEYRFNFFMEIFINLFTYVIDFAVIWVILEKFKTINGWSYYEVVFVYNMNLFSYGMACLFFYIPMRNLESMVKSGDFESLLIRPISPFTHLLLKQNYLGFLSHIILSIFMFGVCFKNLNMLWNGKNIFFFVVTLIGAVLIQASVLIFIGSLSMKYIAANSLMNVLIYDIRSFIQYPIHIYPIVIQAILTFVVPYAFVNFYPSQYLFNIQSGYWSIGYEVCIGASIVGVVLFVGAIRFFYRMVNSYQGVGH